MIKLNKNLLLSRSKDSKENIFLIDIKNSI